MIPTQTEQELYDKLNDYRKQLQADSLTLFDIQQFMKTCQIHEVEPKEIYKHIALGNACSWKPYKMACADHEKYKRKSKK
ncbi:hypothetical protein Mpsy_2276 [Methanolobus psychrophilus R15]|nr:hypothetical protein Mpsy_2276 [Methanolobus psychrophilus R15]